MKNVNYTFRCLLFNKLLPITHCIAASSATLRQKKGRVGFSFHLHEFNCKTPLISTELFKFSVIKINWPFHLQLLLLIIPCTLAVITTNNSVSISHFSTLFFYFLRNLYLIKVCKISFKATTEHFAMNNHHRIRCT